MNNNLDINVDQKDIGENSINETTIIRLYHEGYDCINRFYT